MGWKLFTTGLPQGVQELPIKRRIMSYDAAMSWSLSVLNKELLALSYYRFPIVTSFQVSHCFLSNGESIEVSSLWIDAFDLAPKLNPISAADNTNFCHLMITTFESGGFSVYYIVM